MNWLNVFTANTVNYANGTNHFPGTPRDMRALRIAWPVSSKFENALHEAKTRLFLRALERAREMGEVSEVDYWRLRLELENDQA